MFVRAERKTGMSLLEYEMQMSKYVAGVATSVGRCLGLDVDH